MLFARACAICERPGPSPCPACRGELRPVGPFDPPPGVDRALALVDYAGAGRRLVTTVKYAHRRSLVAWLGRGLAEAAGVWWGDLPVGAVVSWVPADVAHRRRRGFDQGAVLARQVAGALGRPSAGLLIRRPGPAQTARNGEERRLGPDLHVLGVVPPAVVVVDDVCTTGASLARAAAGLRAAGAGSVWALVVARTRHDRSRSGAATPKELIHPVDSKNRPDGGPDLGSRVAER